MAERVVKLKPDKERPAAPAIRVRRDDTGFGFVVSAVSKAGVEDWLTLSEFSDFDAAVKSAEERAHQHRLPIRNDTGIEIEEKNSPKPVAKSQPPRPGKRPRQAPTSRRELADIPPLASLFNLPEVIANHTKAMTELAIDRSFAIHREIRDDYDAIHAEMYGDTRDHVCSYTQRTHDQIQGQIRGVITHVSTVQAILYGYLEAAFARIEELEVGAKSLRYEGVWQADRTYSKGSLCTWGGSCWHANIDTDAKPGEDREAWTLMVKKGRDGKRVILNEE